MKYITLLVSALSLFGLSLGCGTAKKTQTSPSGNTMETLKIGVSVPAADHGWTAGVIWWAKQAMELYPDVEWSFVTADTPEKQIKDLETMMVNQVDGIVVLATESAPLTPIAKEINERGILLVNVDRGFLEPVADLFIEGDNKAFGRKAAEFIVNALNGSGNIVILEGIPSTVNSDRVEAALQVFRKHPNIKILDQQSGMWDRKKSLDVMQTFLIKHPKIDVVWAADDDMALGAEQAIQEAGRQNEMWILGGGGMKEIVKRVMEGDRMYRADITYPPSMIAIGIHEAVSILRDGKRKEILKFMPKHIYIDCEIITPENAKRYYFEDSVY